MTTSLAPPDTPVMRLDYGLLQGASVGIAVLVLAAAPLSPDPLAMAAGGLVPWLVLRIVAVPVLPAIVVFYLLWQWLQVFARALVGMVDGVAMSRSIFGPSVVDAYWHMLASIVVLAVAFRLVMGNTQPPAERLRIAHLAWRPYDLFLIYLGAFGFSLLAGQLIALMPTFYQQINAAAQFKVAALFLLCSVVLTQRRGVAFLVIAVGMEIVIGFSGLLSDFKGPFILLALAALAARIRWSGTASGMAALLAALLLVLSLFWTAVKQDYRDVATGGEETQALRAPIDERLRYIGGRALSAGDIDWRDAGYKLLTRLAYVDILGSVITVDKEAREQAPLQQWSEALQHVFQPRFLFPNKRHLSDIDVYLRLTRGDASDAIRGATSISVGYMAENYVDLGFPLMLAGVFVLGLMVACILRYFMAAPLPWMLREATATALLYTVGATGVELSLPKLLGTAIMFLIVYAILIKFAYPSGIRWLNAQALRAQQQIARPHRRTASR